MLIGVILGKGGEGVQTPHFLESGGRTSHFLEQPKNAEFKLQTASFMQTPNKNEQNNNA